MLKIISLILASLLTLNGCACQPKELADFEAINYKDIKLNCQQLQLAIINAQYYENLAKNHKKNPATYSKIPLVCAPYTYAQGKRVSLGAQSRHEYLLILYKQKKCIEMKVDDAPVKEVVATKEQTDEGQLRFIEIPTTEEIKKK